jgi:hypothetical protein
MLRNVSTILNFVLSAEDGEIGRCKDFLFDDEKWAIRYMVADTRKWLPGRKVLISPISLGAVDWSTRLFQVELTRRQIEDSPSLEEDAPVSRQYEMMFNTYFATSSYWGGTNLWGRHPNPALLRGEHDKLATDFEGPEDNHLRSVKEVTGYNIQATDGDIGHVEDFVVNDEIWALRYVVVDTRNWLPGRKVLVSPQWATAVDWAEEKLRLDLTTDTIKNSPEYEPLAPIDRDYESALHDYYGRPFYWK